METTGLSRYRDSHDKDKTVVRPSYLYDEDHYTHKTASLYWNSAAGLYHQSCCCCWMILSHFIVRCNYLSMPQQCAPGKQTFLQQWWQLGHSDTEHAIMNHNRARIRLISPSLTWYWPNSGMYTRMVIPVSKVLLLLWSRICTWPVCLQ